MKIMRSTIAIYFRDTDDLSNKGGGKKGGFFDKIPKMSDVLGALLICQGMREKRGLAETFPGTFDAKVSG